MAADKNLELVDLQDGGVVCPQCDAFNPLGAVRCQGCGAELEITVKEAPPLPPAPAAEEADSDEEITVRQSIVRPPPAVLGGEVESRRPTDSMPSAVAAAPAQKRCAYCRSLLSASATVCPVCTKPVADAGAPVPQAPADLSIRLRLCRGYGREDATFPIGPGGVTIGKIPATIQIGEDPYLSPLHCRVWQEGGKVLAQDQGSHNGTFLRVRERRLLKQGEEFLIGHQRLLVVGLGGPTTDPRLSRMQQARVFGSPAGRHLFLALRLVCSPPQGGPLLSPVLLRRGPVVTLGRKDCHLNFRADGRLASPHAELHLKSSGIEMVVLGQTGAFVRIEGPAVLQNGDELMLGEEIFRLEMN
jgi:hypothetical protein